MVYRSLCCIKNIKTSSVHSLRYYLFPVFIYFLSLQDAACQIIYANGFENNNPSNDYIYKIDLSTCSICKVTGTSPNIANDDIVVLSDGTILNIRLLNTLVRLEAPPSTQIIWENNGTSSYLGGQLAPDGLVYLGGGSGLGTFDPATNSVTFIGNWPSGFAFVLDLYYIYIC